MCVCECVCEKGITVLKTAVAQAHKQIGSDVDKAMSEPHAASAWLQIGFVVRLSTACVHSAELC